MVFLVYQNIEEIHDGNLLGHIHIEFSENITNQIYIEKLNFNVQKLNILELKSWDEMYFNELEENLNKSISFKRLSKEISDNFKLYFCGNDIGLKLSNKTKNLELYYGLVYGCEVKKYKQIIDKIISYLKFLEIFESVILIRFTLTTENNKSEEFVDVVYCMSEFKMENFN